MDSLPDDILIHILSFLPMKQAALTSVLSKRWRTLFAFTHNLDFDDPFVNNRDKRISNPDEWRKIRKIFRDFVGRTLALQAGRDVKKLSLTVKHIRERSTKHWIRYALKHGVSELHICTTGEMSFLFRDYFTSTTLVKLSLTSLFGITSLPSDTSLPSLKILSLDGIVFRGGQLSDVLLAACPLLEDFTIHHGDYHPESADAISGKTIKNLNYSGKPLFEYYQFDLLVKATLDLRVRVPWFIKQNVEKLLSGIHNVKTLHLTISTVEVISVCCPSIPVFNNLVDLVFSSNEQGWIEFFPRLLECSPNLKVLVLSGLHFYAFQIHHGYVGIEIPLENQIEMLSIKQYQGSANEFTHINHILLKMKHLKELKVYVALTMDESKKMQLTKDLMKLPTASSHEVKISVM